MIRLRCEKCHREYPAFEAHVCATVPERKPCQPLKSNVSIVAAKISRSDHPEPDSLSKSSATDAGLPQDRKFNREEYQKNYIREYMRKRRAKEKAEKGKRRKLAEKK